MSTRRKISVAVALGVWGAAFLLLLLRPLDSVGSGQQLGSVEKGAEAKENAFVDVLWLTHCFGTYEAVDSRNDGWLKGEIAIALRKQGALTASRVKKFMDAETFSKLAGSDGELDSREIRAHLESQEPDSRKDLVPGIAAHFRYLTTTFDQIDETHRVAGGQMRDWIAKNYEHGKPLRVICVCTGNSRRSVLGATMGNAAAAYYGLPEIRFFSGGTKPSACNSRTIATLRAIGVDITALGMEAPRGEEGTANPQYKIRWGKPGTSGRAEQIEFSKRYDDPHNPAQGFAALMVCSDADESCPAVRGASIRISMPYLNPKLYDDTEFESRKYDERRDDIGRLMLSVMMQVRLRFNSTSNR